MSIVILESDAAPVSSSGPCAPWITVADLCGACADTSEFDGATLLRCMSAAQEFCFEATGRRFPGVCTHTIRPCSEQSDYDIPADMIAAPGSYGLYAGNINWQQWVSLGGSCSCDRSRQCGCTRLSEILLDEFHQVSSVTQVKVDGAVLDPSLYRLDDSQYLVRLNDADGTPGSFGCCQDIALPDTEVGTFSVTYTSGTNPPALGVLAAAALACEYALACAGSTQCRLPSRVQSVARQGVNMTFANRALLANGQLGTGIPETDDFISAFAPAYKSYGGFTSVDAPERHRVTG